jgi:hypothetical protein
LLDLTDSCNHLALCLLVLFADGFDLSLVVLLDFAHRSIVVLLDFIHTQLIVLFGQFVL